MMQRSLLGWCVAVFLLVGSRAGADTQSFARNGPVPNLDAIKSAIISYYDSGRHDSDVATVDANMQAYVDRRLRSGVRKPAVVFDIDDTALSTYTYERKHDFCFDDASWSEWERDDRFPAIVPTLRLAQHLAREHVAIFFVTGRRVPERATTIHELALAGYPSGTGYYLRPVDDRAKSVIPFKSAARAKIAALGYDIVASVGDQWSDLRGGYAERLFKLPNPMYFLP
jgi:predicted secreted acid phosphatase